MFRDEILETTHPSHRAHPISIQSSQSDGMQLSISNPQDLLSDVSAFFPTYHDIRVKVSLGIEQGISLLIEKNHGGKDAMGSRVFWSSSVVRFWGFKEESF